MSIWAVSLSHPIAFYFFKLIFIGVLLIYNAVLVSVVQQSESAICIHISSFWFSFYLGHQRALSRVPGAIY